MDIHYGYIIGNPCVIYRRKMKIGNHSDSRIAMILVPKFKMVELHLGHKKVIIYVLIENIVIVYFQ